MNENHKAVFLYVMLFKFRICLFRLTWYSEGAVPPTVAKNLQKRYSVGGTAPYQVSPKQMARVGICSLQQLSSICK